MNSLKIPGLKKDLVVTAEEIIRVEALSNYSRIYFANGKTMVVAKVLRLFQELLPAAIFVRVHKSHLINKLFVENVKEKNGSLTLLFFNGETIPISRRKKLIGAYL